jgi:Esterase-like activity of phytase
MGHLFTAFVALAVTLFMSPFALADTARVSLTQQIDLSTLGGGTVEELSGLAFDAQASVLYAISDGGTLHHLRLVEDGGGIWSVELIKSIKLDFPVVNGEALSIETNGGGGIRLLGAFEDGPATASFLPDGTDLRDAPLPEPLRSPLSYAEAGSRIESVTVDAAGRMLTAPETPLSTRSDKVHTIFRSDGAEFAFPKYLERRSSLKAMDILEDGSLLVLERIRTKGSPFEMRLRLVTLENCGAAIVCPVVDLSVDKPEWLTGNYEGMTHIRGDLFAAVTDGGPRNQEPSRLLLFRLTRP